MSVRKYCRSQGEYVETSALGGGEGPPTELLRGTCRSILVTLLESRRPATAGFDHRPNLVVNPAKKKNDITATMQPYVQALSMAASCATPSSLALGYQIMTWRSVSVDKNVVRLE